MQSQVKHQLISGSTNISHKTQHMNKKKKKEQTRYTVKNQFEISEVTCAI